MVAIKSKSYSYYGKNLFISLLAYLLLTSKLYGDEVKTFSLKVLYQLLRQQGFSGNSLADDSRDQSLTVMEPLVLISGKITEHSSIDAQFVFDSWTSASDRAFDAATSASLSEKQKRVGQTVGLNSEYAWGGYRVALGQSDEWDYQSKNIQLSAYKKLAQDNAMLGLQYAYFDDLKTRYNFLENKSFTSAPKKTHSLGLNFSQLLSSTQMIVAGVTHTAHTGILEGSFNSVSVNGVRVQEELPDEKLSSSPYLKWMIALSNELALHHTATWYRDSWGQQGKSLESSVLYELSEGDGVIEFFHRFYHQSSLSYYANNFTRNMGFMTSDGDLERFYSQHSGILLDYELDFLATLINISAGVTHYRRTNNLNFTTIQLALNISLD